MSTRTDKPAFVTVNDGGRCVGFVMNRGPMGHEAVDADGRPIGFFASLPEAAVALKKGTSAS